jgi:hypothetical protein
MTAAAEAHPRVERSPPAVGRVIGFGASGIDEAGISIPYPQQDVHVRMAEMPRGWDSTGRS